MADDVPPAHAIVHDGWGELVLARPSRRNALTGPMVAAMREGLSALLVGGARAILLRGEGGGFCSGLDLDSFAADPPPAWRAEFGQLWADFHGDLYRCPAVVICALERHAVNAGDALALAADILVVGESAFLLVGEAAVGMNVPMNLAWLRLRTSEAVAAQLALVARWVPARELHRLGLAWQVHPDADVVPRARELATALASYPGHGLTAVKASLRRSRPEDEAVFGHVAAGPATAPPPRR